MPPIGLEHVFTLIDQVFMTDPQYIEHPEFKPVVKNIPHGIFKKCLE